MSSTTTPSGLLPHGKQTEVVYVYMLLYRRGTVELWAAVCRAEPLQQYEDNPLSFCVCQDTNLPWFLSAGFAGPRRNRYQNAYWSTAPVCMRKEATKNRETRNKRSAIKRKHDEPEQNIDIRYVPIFFFFDSLIPHSNYYSMWLFIRMCWSYNKSWISCIRKLNLMTGACEMLLWDLVFNHGCYLPRMLIKKAQI